MRVGWVESRHLPGPCSPTGRWRLVRIWLVVDKLMTISGFVEGCLVRKISRIGPQKGLKNAKSKGNSRGRKIMSKDSEQKRERRLFKIRSSILKREGKWKRGKGFGQSRKRIRLLERENFRFLSRRRRMKEEKQGKYLVEERYLFVKEKYIDKA